jgi:hypothetical protein
MLKYVNTMDIWHLQGSDSSKDFLRFRTSIPSVSAVISPFVYFSCGNKYLCNILKPCHISICLIFSSYLKSYFWSISTTWHKYSTTNPAHRYFDLKPQRSSRQGVICDHALIRSISHAQMSYLSIIIICSFTIRNTSACCVTVLSLCLLWTQ